MADYQYHVRMFERLEPRNVWAGGRITSTDTVTLNEAARFASQHAGAEITPADFLRAAARGEILLRALCSRAVIMLPTSNEDEPLHIAENSLPTLPLGACKSIVNIGRATWRIYEKTKLHEDPLLGRTFIRFTAWELPENEADLIVHLDDCRVTGHDVHALADAYVKAPEQTAATPAPVETGSASGGVETDKTRPLPLTTGDIAFCFAGLRWNEQEWKKPLGDKPKWLRACIAIPGVRGVSETRWNPVLIGAALEREGHAKQNSIRARFQTKPQLAEWLNAWKTYEADNLATE